MHSAWMTRLRRKSTMRSRSPPLRTAAFASAFILPLPPSGSHPDRRSMPWRASGSRRCTCRAARSPCCRPKQSSGSRSPKAPSAPHVPCIWTYTLTILPSRPAPPVSSGCALRPTYAIRRSRSLMLHFLPERRGGTFRQEMQHQAPRPPDRSEEHTSELQSHVNLVCRLLLEKKKINQIYITRNEYM